MRLNADCKIGCQHALAIAFLIMLIVGTLLIPLVQLLLQLLVALGELLYRRGEDLYFSF